MILDAIEFSFQFSDLNVLSVHILASAGPVLVDLVDDQGKIAEHYDILCQVQ